MKKVIIIVLIVISILILFILYNFYSFNRLKNDCIKNNTKNGYFFSIEFDSRSSQSDIDIFVSVIKRDSRVKKVEIESKDEALQRFMKENNSPLIKESLDKIGENPFGSSIKIELDVFTEDAFISTTDNVLDQAKKYNLNVLTSNGSNIIYLRAVESLRNSSFFKIFPVFILSDEKINFFENNFPLVCGGFPRQ